MLLVDTFCTGLVELLRVKFVEVRVALMVRVTFRTGFVELLIVMLVKVRVKLMARVAFRIGGGGTAGKFSATIASILLDRFLEFSAEKRHIPSSIGFQRILAC